MTFTRRQTIGMLAATPALGAAKPSRAPLDPDGPAARELAHALGPKLIAPKSQIAACLASGGEGADALFKTIQNPYLLGDDPALTQTLGWTGAWTSQPSPLAVAAETAADIAKAVDIARRHDLRVVVKGGGHSYYGNSNAAGSLLLWTRKMDAVELHDAFVPAGAPKGNTGVPAVSVGAGAIWGRVYHRVMVEARRYVQGGGCLTVGVAGFVSGGGFGSLSKQFGTGAANLLEAEIVTADGTIRICNAHRDPDLFFALRGGAGGSFGVITRLTLRTDPLPKTIGAILFSVEAKSDAAWHALVTRMIAFYAEKLFEPRWGEQMRFGPGRRLSVTMLFHGLTQAEVEALWAPMLEMIRADPAGYAWRDEPAVIAASGQEFWDPAFLRRIEVVLPDARPDAPERNVFWATNLSEAAQVLHAYESAWLPAVLLEPGRRAALVETLIEAARGWSVSLHTNKGMAGGDPAAIARVRETATNPAVCDAFALLICAADAPPAYPGIPGHEPDVAQGAKEKAAVQRAMAAIRRLVPDAGAYVSEADYFQQDWQRAFWGENYARLLKAKRRYDPGNLFTAHQTVGSG